MLKRRWIQVLLAVLLVTTLALVAMAGSCAYLVRQQVQIREASSLAEFDREASAVLARFEGVPTLVEDTDTGPRLSSRALATRQKQSAAAATKPLDHLHVLVFSTTKRTLVRLSLPFWLLRLSPDGTVDIKNGDVDLARMRLSVGDLEAAGPGPLFVRTSGESRVLAWTE